MAVNSMHFESGRGCLTQLSRDTGLPVIGGYELSRDFVIKVEGELEITESRGFGLFRTQRTNVEKFSFSMHQEGETIEPCPGLRFKVSKAQGGWVVTGRLRGVACYFGEFAFEAGEDASFNFVMLSVLGTVLRGKAVLAQPSLAKKRYMA